jgi:hypothetical protein
VLRAPNILLYVLDFNGGQYYYFFLLLVGWDWVPRYCGRFGLLYKLQMIDEDDFWSNWWNEDWQGKPKYSDKSCPSATLSTTKSHMTRPGLEPRTAAFGSQRLTAWAMARPLRWPVDQTLSNMGRFTSYRLRTTQAGWGGIDSVEWKIGLYMCTRGTPCLHTRDNTRTNWAL